MGWNAGPHRRKYMRSEGTAIDRDGRVVAGDLAFWGEWEAESRYTTLAEPPTDAHPRYLHEPFWREPHDDAFRQNTDPYVFGEHFRYSNCKQLHQGRPSGMQTLDLGSMVLFGGCKEREHFLVDTVFVVADAKPWSIDATDEVTDSTFRRVTCDSVATGSGVEHDLTMYEGATAANTINGMFSFVPCELFRPGSAGFVKPAIRLESIINPRSIQAPKATSVSEAAAFAAWTSVREQVLSQGLLLGTQFATPPLVLEACA